MRDKLMPISAKKPSAAGARLSMAIVLCACIAFAGCARKPQVITTEAPLDYGQFALRGLPTEIDLEALKGKRIVIDPGHGGVFPGAVGPNNLREADVNLGVGMYLWGMLKQAGADAYLTRISDSVVYQGNDLDLKKDLQARAELGKFHEADLFLSLHHNADVLPDKKKNSLETYFKMSDPGPSLDVAKSIHRQLAVSLNQPDNLISPGNFHVLRETATAAVLGEPSYISHKDNSFRLGLAPMQRLEAQAYLLGIAEYFSKGVPVIEDIQPAGVVSNDPRPIITARTIADRGIPIDPNSIVMLLDGSPVRAEFDRETSQVKYLPPARLSNGKHVVRISLCNVDGNAAKPRQNEIEIAMPPGYVLLTANFTDIISGSETPIRLKARVFDSDLLPVADGTQVEFATAVGRLSAPVALTRNGEAFSYLLPGKNTGEGEINVTANASGLKHSLKLTMRKGAPKLFAAKMLDAVTGLPVEDVLVQSGDLPLGHSDHTGYFAVSGNEIEDATGGSLRVTFLREGYEPCWIARPDFSAMHVIRLKPVAGGILFGKRFALDPQFGGEEKGTTGPTGVRASDLNLDVARHLARFLRASGAEVVLTRELDETVSALRRVELAERFGAEWFISIGHGQGGPASGKIMEEAGSGRVKVIHYPTSKDGKKLAESIAGALLNRGIADKTSLEPGATFVLTHTASPAVIVIGPRPATHEMEERLRHPSAARREAYALYCGILENLGLSRKRSGEIEVGVMDADGNAVAGVMLTLDGAFLLETDYSGKSVFSRLTPGEHYLEVYADGVRVWGGMAPVEAGNIVSIDISLAGVAVVSAPASM